MNQSEKAETFAALHQPGAPLILYNIWDAGSARVVAEAGAKAVATGSVSVAGAQGFPDGQAIPLDLLLTVAERITASVDLPVTVDFEGAYATEPEAVAANAGRLIGVGAVGCNFEDQVIGGEGLHDIAAQAARIRAMREAADAAGARFFINARTDLFLKEPDKSRHPALLSAAKERAAAFAEAGASGFFAPALFDLDAIADLVAATPLPVNIIALPGAPSHADLAKAGVARISYGPVPYRVAMKDLAAHYAADIG